MTKAKPSRGKGKRAVSSTSSAAANPLPMRQHETLRVEKIENGYLCTRCVDSPKGYQETKYYSPSSPLKSLKK